MTDYNIPSHVCQSLSFNEQRSSFEGCDKFILAVQKDEGLNAMYEGLKDLNPMRHGDFLSLLWDSGGPWKTMGTHEKPWGPMKNHGDPWKTMGTHEKPWGPWKAIYNLWLFVMDMKYVETCWRILGDLVLGRILDATKHLQTWSVVQDHQKPANVRKPRLENSELHSRQDLFIITIFKYNYICI